MHFKNYTYFFLFSIVLLDFATQTMEDNKNRQLADKIERIIASHTDLQLGIEVYSLNQEHVIYAKNELQKFTPASNTKIATALLALELLGENYRFQTQLLFDGTLGQDGGNIYIKGFGDPSLTSENIEFLIKALRDNGIKTVGNVYLDNQEFDHECFAAGTTIDDLGEPWYNPVEALVIDHAAVAIDPLNIVSFTDSEKLQKIFFDGSLLIRELLKKYGIVLTGTILEKAADTTCQVIAEHKSAPLSELIRHLLKESDNLYADCLFKKIGALGQTPGTWQKGSSAIKNFFNTKLGINPEEIKIADGSGASRYNLLSADQLVKLLCWAYKQPYFSAFVSSLPIAGVDGTLKDRMKDIPCRVKAKTGTMSGISALSGYIETDHDTLVFACLINGFIANQNCQSCKTDIEDVLCKVLVDNFASN